MTPLALSRFSLSSKMIPRGIVISSRLPRRYLQLQSGLQSTTRTSISCNPYLQHARLSNSSVRPAALQPSTTTKNSECTASVKVSAFSIDYWKSRVLWKRAGINTLRCLFSCTLGDFSAMWFLQSQHPELGIVTIMGISSKTT